LSVPLIKSASIGSGHPLVLLHAFPLFHGVWKEIQPPVGYRFILPDFPGFSLSPLPQSEISFTDVAQGLNNHLLEQGIEGPIILGGISMGGYWLLEFLRLYPEKVRALMLISTRAGIDKPEAKQRRLETAEKVEKQGMEFLVQVMLPGLLGKTTLLHKPKIVQLVSQWILDASTQAVASAQRAMASRRDQGDLLPKIKVPVLVITGEEDTLIPVSEAQSMAQDIPDSQIRILTNTGHLVPLEVAGEFQKCLEEFIGKVDLK